MPSELIIHTDGGSRGNPGPAALGVVIESGGEVLFEVGKFLGQKTNNEAEYAAFALSVDWVVEHLAEHPQAVIVWKLDSKLVVEQLLKVWKIKEPRMLVFAQEIWKKLDQIKQTSGTYKILHVPRNENAHADMLVNQALDAAR